MAARESAAVSTSTDHAGIPVQRTEPRERIPWLLASLCLLIGFLPSNSVIAGPLKSNGSPAVLIAITLFGLSLLGFGLIRRTADRRTLRPGVVVILTYLALNLAVAGVGWSHFDSTQFEASKTRSLIWLVATVGVPLYIMTRVETTRQRTILLGCLATGLTFACFVAVLQNSMRIDLHLLFQPPGFVVNTSDQGRGAGTDFGELRFGSVRARGTTLHPIELSVMAAAAVPLTIHFARYAANGRCGGWLGSRAA